MSTGPASGITLVVLGLVCFYVTYVSYRNLKNFLPFIRGGQTRQGDYELHKFDQWLMFGNDPAIVLHNVASARPSRRTCCPGST